MRSGKYNKLEATMNNNAVLRRMLVISGIMSLLFLAGCGGSTSQSLNNQPPTPTITTISPNSAAAGDAAFTLTITGTNFVAASVVNFGGAARTTAFVSATQLTAVVAVAAIVTAGIVEVTVTNPAPGGGTSNAVNFTITSASGTNPVPTINSLSPSCAPEGEQVLNPNLNGHTLYDLLPFLQEVRHVYCKPIS